MYFKDAVKQIGEFLETFILGPSASVTEYKSEAYKRYNTRSLIRFSIKGINMAGDIKPGFFENTFLKATTKNPYDPFAIEVIEGSKVIGYLPKNNKYLHQLLLEQHNSIIETLYIVIDRKYDDYKKKTYLVGEVALIKEFAKNIDISKLKFD